MNNADEHGNPRPPNRWRDDRPPSPTVLKLALLAAAIILLIGILIYMKARHEPPALHDQVQMRNAAIKEARSFICPARIYSYNSHERDVDHRSGL